MKWIAAVALVCFIGTLFLGFSLMDMNHDGDCIVTIIDNSVCPEIGASSMAIRHIAGYAAFSNVLVSVLLLALACVAALRVSLRRLPRAAVLAFVPAPSRTAYHSYSDSLATRSEFRWLSLTKLSPSFS